MASLTCIWDGCGRSFTRVDNLCSHVRTVHRKDKKYECGICQKRFSRYSHKVMHLRTRSSKVTVGGGINKRKIYEKTKTSLKFTPTLRKSAFGGSFFDWIIQFPRDYDALDPAYLL